MQGARAFFRLSPHAIAQSLGEWAGVGALSFAIRRSELDSRIDAKYLALQETLELAKYPLQALGSLVKREPNYGSGARAVMRSGANSPRYIRITDFGEDGIEEGHEYVTAEPIEWDCLIEANDLLFARSGATVGKTYLHEDTSESAIFAGYCIRFCFDDSLALPRFIYWFTKTKVYARWTQAIQRPSGQPNINKEEFKSLLVPLPNIIEQRNLVAQIDTARTERKAKLAEADALLADLDGFLLETLGLVMPPKDERKVFAIPLNKIGKRIDPYSNQSRFRKLLDHIQDSKFRVATFSEVAIRIFSGTTPLAKGDAYVTPPTGIRFIRSGEITSDGGVLAASEVHICDSIHNGIMKSSQLECNDLLIAIVGATIGATGVFNHDEPANINQAIAAVRLNESIISSEFACLYLRSSLGQALLDYFKRPVARANINLEEVGEIPLVIPPIAVQNNIAAEARRRRAEARTLRAEAEQGWREAKAQFEVALLGGTIA